GRRRVSSLRTGASMNPPASPTAHCRWLHRRLCQTARSLASLLPVRARDDAERLRLAARWMSAAAERAWGTLDASEALRSWLECELSERQIRVASYRALCKLAMTNVDHAAVSEEASQASRARRQLLLRPHQRPRRAPEI